MVSACCFLINGLRISGLLISGLRINGLLISGLLIFQQKQMPGISPGILIAFHMLFHFFSSFFIAKMPKEIENRSPMAAMSGTPFGVFG